MDKPIEALGSLLAADEPAALNLENMGGASPIFLICEHAGKRIPEKLGDLGVSAAERERHIAWDIGALAVARGLSRRLDAPLAHQTYSRLVCDCNRQTSAPDFMPRVSESTEIPGNHALGDAERRRRIAEVYDPFHDGVTAALDARLAAGRPTVVISIHSFTPVYKGVSRPWHCGVLTMEDPLYAPRTLELLRAEQGPGGGPERTLRDDPRDRLHDPGARRGPGPAVGGDRDPSGPGRRCGGAGGLGGTFGSDL